MSTEDKIEWLVKAENLLVNYSSCTCFKPREDDIDSEYFSELFYPDELDGIMERDKKELKEMMTKVIKGFEELLN